MNKPLNERDDLRPVVDRNTADDGRNHIHKKIISFNFSCFEFFRGFICGVIGAATFKLLTQLL